MVLFQARIWCQWANGAQRRLVNCNWDQNVLCLCWQRGIFDAGNVYWGRGWPQVHIGPYFSHFWPKLVRFGTSGPLPPNKPWLGLKHVLFVLGEREFQCGGSLLVAGRVHTCTLAHISAIFGRFGQLENGWNSICSMCNWGLVGCTPRGWQHVD